MILAVIHVVKKLHLNFFQCCCCTFHFEFQHFWLLHFLYFVQQYVQILLVRMLLHQSHDYFCQLFHYMYHCQSLRWNYYKYEDVTYKYIDLINVIYQLSYYVEVVFDQRFVDNIYK
jgi:hypothetical protein